MDSFPIAMHQFSAASHMMTAPDVFWRDAFAKPVLHHLQGSAEGKEINFYFARLCYQLSIVYYIGEELNLRAPKKSIMNLSGNKSIVELLDVPNPLKYSQFSKKVAGVSNLAPLIHPNVPFPQDLMKTLGLKSVATFERKMEEKGLRDVTRLLLELLLEGSKPDVLNRFRTWNTAVEKRISTQDNQSEDTIADLCPWLSSVKLKEIPLLSDDEEGLSSPEIIHSFLSKVNNGLFSLRLLDCIGCHITLQAEAPED